MGSERSFARENPKVVTSKVDGQDEHPVKVSHPPSPDNLMHIITLLPVEDACPVYVQKLLFFP